MKRENFIKMTAMFAAVFAMAFMCACSDKDEPTPEPTPEVPEEQETPENPENPEVPEEPEDYSRGEIELDADEQAFAESYYKFSMESFEFLMKETDSEETNRHSNILFSPLGVSYVTGLLANAAEGDIRKEFLDTYSHSGLTLDVLNKFHQKVMTSLPILDRSATVKLANSVWTRSRDKNNISQAFYDSIENFYDADVNFVNDFEDMRDIDKINEWVSENTFGTIPKFFESPLSMWTRALFFNTLYFKNGWSVEFDSGKTAKETFTNADGTKSTVDMMCHEYISVWQCNGESYIGTNLRYGNGAYCMMLFMPREGYGIEDCVEELKSEWFYFGIWAKGLWSDDEVPVKLPKFDITGQLGLMDLYAARGVEKAFDQTKSEFSGMYISNPSAYLSDAVQKVRISVDEKKAEASSATMVEISDGEKERSYIFDRPFVFIIAEHSTGLPLFMGRVTKL